MKSYYKYWQLSQERELANVKGTDQQILREASGTRSTALSQIRSRTPSQGSITVRGLVPHSKRSESSRSEQLQNLRKELGELMRRQTAGFDSAGFDSAISIILEGQKMAIAKVEPGKKGNQGGGTETEEEALAHRRRENGPNHQVSAAKGHRTTRRRRNKLTVAWPPTKEKGGRGRGAEEATNTTSLSPSTMAPEYATRNWVSNHHWGRT